MQGVQHRSNSRFSIPRSLLGRLIFAGGALVFIVGYVGLHQRGYETQHAGLALMVVGALISLSSMLLFGTFQRLGFLRLIEDLPTAKIRSSPQGYVELRGRVLQAIKPLTCPQCGARCVWFQYPSTRHSDAYPLKPPPVLIDDGTGTCAVDLANAQVLYARSRWDRHYHVLEGDELHVLGDFRAMPEHLPPPGVDLRSLRIDEINRRLRELKKDPKRMAAFDVDGDGQVDFREWEAAHRATGLQVDREFARSTQPAFTNRNVITAPASNKDRLPFLVFVGDEARARRSAVREMALYGLIVVGMMLFSGFVYITKDGELLAAERKRTAAVAAAKARAEKAAAAAQAKARPRPAPSEFERLRHRDYQMALKGEWPQIVAMWDDYIHDHGNDARAYYERGGAKFHGGDRLAAQEDLDTACGKGYQRACVKLPP